MGTRGSFFERLHETEPGRRTFEGRYRATEHSVGPWGEHLQHGGPPTALALRAAQSLGRVPDDALAARLSAEIFAPIPVTEVVARASVPRPGRRVAWTTAELAAAAEPDRPLLRCHVWLIRRTPQPLDVPPTPVAEPPQPGTPKPPPPGWNGGYLRAVTWAATHGSFDTPGAATVWTSLLVDLVDGEQPTGTQHATIVADAGNGISAVANPGRMVFVNTELTVRLHREPTGPQVWMASSTVIDPHGIGQTHTELGDARSGCGSADQTLFVEPR